MGIKDEKLIGETKKLKSPKEDAKVDTLNSDSDVEIKNYNKLPKDNDTLDELVKPYIQESQGANITKQRKNKRVLKIIFFVALISLLLIGILGGSVLVAYDKINLPSKTLQKKITDVVTSISFMPKKSEQILLNTFVAQKNLKKFGFNINISSNASDIIKGFGLSGDDSFLVGGFLDFSDSKKINSKMNLIVGNDFNFDLLLKDYVFYFKTNKVPQPIKDLLWQYGIDFANFKDTWVYYDLTPTRDKSINSSGYSKAKSTDVVATDILEVLKENELLSKIRMEDSVLGSEDIYLFTLDLDKDGLNKLNNKYKESNYDKYADINNLTIKMFVGKNDYYIRKLVIKIDSTIKQSEYLSVLNSKKDLNGKNVSLNFVLKLSDYNKDINLEVPSGARSLDKIMVSRITETTSSAVEASAGFAK